MYASTRWRTQLANVLTGRSSPPKAVVVLTDEQDRLLRRAARLMGSPPTEFLLESALTRARTIVDLNSASRTDDAFDRFMAADPSESPA